MMRTISAMGPANHPESGPELHSVPNRELAVNVPCQWSMSEYPSLRGRDREISGPTIM
jgi:hypothetical protein